jgi:hypothetical protein
MTEKLQRVAKARHKGTPRTVQSKGAGAHHPPVQNLPKTPQNRARQGLTAKQEVFAQAVSNGLTLADAYRAAYEASDMKEATIWSESSRLMANPRVTARIGQLIRAKEQETLNEAVELRRMVIQRLTREAEIAEPASARIRALELLGKLDMVGLFKPLDQKPMPERTAEQIEEDVPRQLLIHFNLTALCLRPS